MWKLQDAGYTLSDDELNRAFLRFKSLADKKKQVSTLDLESIVNDEMRDVNIRRFELVGMQVRRTGSLHLGRQASVGMVLISSE